LFFKVITKLAFELGLGNPSNPFLFISKDPSPYNLPIKGSITSLESGRIGLSYSCLGYLNLPLLNLKL
jgi:hypothetical protein